MASRMKKIFHRKKEDGSDHMNSRSRVPSSSESSDPAFRASLYDSTTAAGLPQAGDYPIRGKDSSVMLQSGRRSSVRSVRSRRSSSRGSHYDDARRNPRSSPPPHSSVPTRSYDPYQDTHNGSAMPLNTQDNNRKRWSRSPLHDQFSGLNLGDGQAPTTVTHTVTTTTTPHHGTVTNVRTFQPQESPYQNRKTAHPVSSPDPASQEPYTSRGDIQASPYGNHSNGGTRAGNQGEGLQSSSSRPVRDNYPSKSRGNNHDTPVGQDDYNTLSRQKSIPRKQVGSSGQFQSSPVHHSNPLDSETDHGRQERPSKALPSTPVHSNHGYEPRNTANSIQITSILDRSRPISKGATSPRSTQDIVDRAKTNTYDTQVIEKVAPAVVHENITKDVHHIREEVVTREVHTHDVFHRMLPIIDVEVLPPRHFLPVEGGGLVEVSAAEVPGRGNNWVIAETASKIPSDQAAPKGRRPFTARAFPGEEGDAKRYVTPEGIERTEETWVHWPELETGAQLTGQSWPMVFDDDAQEKTPLSNVNDTSNSRKSPTKVSAVQASPGQKAARYGRVR